MKLHIFGIAIPLSLCLILPVAAHAQGSLFTTLHAFSVFPQGAQPEASLLQASDGNFYGTTAGGGTNGGTGTIFRMTPTGTLTTLHTFTGGNDGAYPYGALVQGADGNLYGTCSGGGDANGDGTLFKISTSGTFTTLYAFTGGSDGANPHCALVKATDGNLYGTCSGGGDANGDGTVFQVSTSGALATVYTFTGGSDGATPYCTLVQSTDGNLYGTCYQGGDANGDGTIFQVSTNGAFTTLYTFGDGSDSANPEAGLIQATDGNFYGTASGFSDHGDIFRIATNGTFTTLYSFTGGSDGSTPYAALIQANNGNLYGTTSGGGSYGGGTIFNITTNGGTPAIVHEFSNGTDGAHPNAGLIQAKDGSLWGTTADGNTNNAGTIFKITSGGLYATWIGFPGMLDGAEPSADLSLGKDGHLYGTAEGGGTTGNGAVFSATLNGDVTVLHSFGTVTNASGVLLDGSFPEDKPIQGSDGNIYGTTESDGANGYGTVFMVTTNGTFATLYAFTGGSDGGEPEAGLVQGQDGNFYGTTSYGGSTGSGTVFQIKTNGMLTTIYSFTGGSDGSTPFSTLVQDTNGNLYGTCSGGGDGNGDGTIFQVTTNGAFTPVYTFTGGSDGSGPEAGLIQGTDGNFYGTATYGGNGNGTVFKVTGTGAFTTLWDFTGGSDGADPEGALIQGADGNLYGTTAFGGNANGNGTVFQVTTNGNFTTLWEFTGGSDGGSPDDGLVAGSNGSFYGLAENGGAGGLGTLFQINLAPALQPPTITGGTITFNWNAVVGLEYQVQFTTALGQSPWVNVGAPFVATSQANQVQESTAPGHQGFYRVVLLP